MTAEIASHSRVLQISHEPRDQPLRCLSSERYIAETIPGDGNVLTEHQQDQYRSLPRYTLASKRHQECHREGADVNPGSNLSRLVEHPLGLIGRSREEAGPA